MSRKMENKLSRNLIFLRESKGFSQTFLSDKLGVKPNTISNYERGVSSPDIDTLLKLSNIFEVSLDDLISSNNIEKASKKEGDYAQIIKEPDNKYAKGKPVVVTVEPGGKDNMVMVDQKAAAGYVHNIGEPTYMKHLPTIRIDDPRFQNATFRAFQIEGDSMMRTLKPGQWVAARLLDDYRSIREGYVHIIVTKDMVTAKRVLNRINEREKIVCLSDNKQYPAFELDVEDVVEIWFVTCKLLDFDLSNPDMDLINLYNTLQADVVALKSELTNLKKGLKDK